MLKKVYCAVTYNKETDTDMYEDYFDTSEEAEQYKENNEDETCYIEIEEKYIREFFRINVNGYHEGDYEDAISAALGIARCCIKDFLNDSDTEYAEYIIEKMEE